MSASRQTFEIAPAEVDADGEITTGDVQAFTYQFPFIDVSSRARTKTHEPIDEEPVVQSLGPEAREITIEGHCYLPEANFIDGLIDGGLVDVVSDRWSGQAVVDTAETTATGEGGGKAGTTTDRLYEYRLVLHELTDNRPESVGTIE